MKPVAVIRSRTVVLPVDDVDTDQIIPARFLVTTSREGLEKALFADWRWDEDGGPREGFVLNRRDAEGARVLVLGQTCAQVTNQTKTVAASLNPPVTVTITPSTCTGVTGDAMSVTVTYKYKSVTPLGHFAQLLTGPITMSSTSTMRHE